MEHKSNKTEAVMRLLTGKRVVTNPSLGSNLKDEETAPKNIEPQVTAQPQVEQPRVEPQVAAQPQVEQPRVEPQVAVQPQVEQPRVEPQVAVQPQVEQPRVEPQVAVQPQVEQPRVEPQVAVQPQVEQPRVEPQVAAQPQIEQPRVEPQVTVQPQVEQPRVEPQVAVQQSIVEIDVTGELITELMPQVLKRFNCCQCPICYADAVTEAGNRVPTIKVKINGKEDMKMVDKMKDQHRKDVMMTLVRLALERKPLPKHD